MCVCVCVDPTFTAPQKHNRKCSAIFCFTFSWCYVMDRWRSQQIIIIINWNSSAAAVCVCHTDKVIQRGAPAVTFYSNPAPIVFECRCTAALFWLENKIFEMHRVASSMFYGDPIDVSALQLQFQWMRLRWLGMHSGAMWTPSPNGDNEFMVQNDAESGWLNVLRLHWKRRASGDTCSCCALCLWWNTLVNDDRRVCILFRPLCRQTTSFVYYLFRCCIFATFRFDPIM